MDISNEKLFYKIKRYDRVFFVSLFSFIIYVIAAIYNETFAKIMPVSSFLTWHTLFESASVLVSFSLFTVTYFIYEETKSVKMVVFGCSFLLMGGLDALHTLSYKGMPYFFIANNTANRATTLWILSRLLGSIGIAVAMYIPANIISKIKKEVFGGITIVLTSILFIIVTYYPNFFPPMFLEGIGLTSIKLFLEYFIMIILIITFFIVAKQYSQTRSSGDYKFMVALVLLLFSEFSFTSYGSIYDAFNYIGHFYKVIAYSILYESIYIQNIRLPFKEIKRSKNELKKHSDNLNVIVEQRTQELEKVNKTLLNDIEYAKEVQDWLRPKQMPNNTSVTFDAEYLAAEHLSGDFYNVVRLDDENIALYIGDVSGHGISAAMLTVFAYQSVIQLKDNDGKSSEIIEPGSVLRTIYDSFNKTNINEEKYILMLYGIYNIKKKTFTYASAGINVEPYIIKKSGKIFKIDIKGFPICKLGDFVSPDYKNTSLQLEKGDKVLFYSDGLVEAKNKNGQVYGQDKLEIFLKNNHKLNSIELNSSLKNDFFEHINYSNKLADDVTFLTMSIKD